MIPRWRTSEMADAALWLTIVLAPLAGGSASLYVLPVLGLLVSTSYVASIFDHKKDGHRLYLFALPFGLALLALLTLLQTVPLPPALLGWLSPKALEIRTFVGEEGWAPISYEPAATAREAAKLVLYGMVALAAADRARLRKSFELVAAPVVIAGMASLLVGAIQRALQAERMLGILPSMRSPAKLLTTFVNPNHASAFLLLVSLVAVGQALVDATRPGRRNLYAAAGVIAAIGSVLCFSRGGLGALVGSYVLALAVLFLRRRSDQSETLARAGLVVGVTILFAAIGAILQYDELVRAFQVTEADPLGIEAKLAAVKDAIPLVFDHKWTGIGRGSYVSIYPAYKTANFQLTFTHPENIVAEVFSDWGLVVGGLALLTYLVAMLRRIKGATSPAVLVVVIGILVITGQNLVDFNLELPGMAIPVVALLGAATPRALVFTRVWPKKRLIYKTVAFAPIALLVVATWLAFALGDLTSDQEQLDRAVHARRLDRSTRPSAREGQEVTPPIADLAVIAQRHPASSVMTAQLAYLAETADPPDWSAALRFANRTLFLAPTYADGHLMVGRLLVRGGHRSQGFQSFRRGWDLVPRERKSLVIKQVVSLAKTLEEVEEAIPRRVAELDILDEGEVAAAIEVLVEAKKNVWALALLAQIDPEQVQPLDAVAVGRAASLLGNLDLALRVAESRLAAHAGDVAATQLLLDVLWKQNDITRIEEVVARILARPEVDPTPFLRMRIQVAVKQGQLELAQKSLDQLSRRMPPTVENQVELARLEANVAERAGLPDRVLRALDRAIQLAPSNVQLRFQRAETLARIGRVTEARADVEAVLKMEPGHGGARGLLGKLRAARTTMPPPRVEDAPEEAPEPSE